MFQELSIFSIIIIQVSHFMLTYKVGEIKLIYHNAQLSQITIWNLLSVY